jgi:DNA invertase Pin-like site-specific DNA recombinase
MKYGYARVSTDGQSVRAQVRQLTKVGCKKVFRETASGAKTDRTQLRKALDQLDGGDVLMVTRLDRLARSTRDLLNTRRDRRPQGRFPIPWRYMGQYHQCAWLPHADCAGRVG